MRLALPPVVKVLIKLLEGNPLLATLGIAEVVFEADRPGAQTFGSLEVLTAMAILCVVNLFPVARRAEWREHRLAAATR